MIGKIIKVITWGFFFLAVWIIQKEIRIVGAQNLIRLILDTPLWVMGVAGVWIIMNYVVLSGYDWLALDYIGEKVPYKDVFNNAAIGFAFSNTTGHTYAAGGAIRYWLYVPIGIPKIDILKMILFETLTIFIGITVSFLVAIFLMPIEPFLPGDEFYAIGMGILILLSFYMIGIVLPQKKIRIKNISFSAPTKKMTMAQIAVGFADNTLLFLIFYTFLRYHLNAPILETFTVFIIAQSIGFMAQVPGGLGVFEGSFLYLFPHSGPQKSALLASLILFRIFYYFIPFLIAMGFLGIKFLKDRLRQK